MRLPKSFFNTGYFKIFEEKKLRSPVRRTRVNKLKFRSYTFHNFFNFRARIGRMRLELIGSYRVSSSAVARTRDIYYLLRLYKWVYASFMVVFFFLISYNLSSARYIIL